MVQFIQLGPKRGKSAFEGLLEGLGTGVTKGFEKAGEQRQTNKLASLLGIPQENVQGLSPRNFLTYAKYAQDKVAAQAKANAPFVPDDIGKYAKAYNLDLSDFGGPEEIQTALNKLNSLIPILGKERAAQEFFSNTEKYLTPEEDIVGEAAISSPVAQEGPAQSSFLSSLIKGPQGREQRREGSLLSDILSKTKEAQILDKYLSAGLQSGSAGATSALIDNLSYTDYKKASSKPEGGGVLGEIKYTLGKLASDSPTFLAGASLGKINPALGAAAAFGLPVLFNKTVEQYLKYKEQGGVGSLEDFIYDTAETLAETGKSSLAGYSLSFLSKAIPILKETSPAIKRLFESTAAGPIAEQAAKIGIESTGLIATEAAISGQIPSPREILTTFAQVTGFNLVGLGQKEARSISEKIQKTGNPQEAINRINEVAKERGIDIEKVNAGDKAEAKKLNRAVEDITKTYEAKAEIELPRETAPKEQERRAEARKKEAETLAARPLEEYLEEKPPYESPAMKAEKLKASKELISIDRDIERVQGNVTRINAALEEGVRSTKQRVSLEKTRANFENQLEKLQEHRKEQEYISKRGIKPFSEAEAKAQAEQHVKTLEEVARNPESETAVEWNRMFDRDQKYIDQQIERLKRGGESVEPYKDRYIKQLDAYNEVYRKASADLDRRIANAKGKEKLELQKVKHKLDRNLAINEAKLSKQREKLATKQAIKQESSVMRQLLQQLKKDIPGLKEPIIEYKKAVEGIEKKTSETAFKSLERAATDYIKNDKATIESIEKPIEEVLESQDIPKETKKRISDHLKKAVEIWKENKGHPDKAITEIRKIYKDMPFAQRILVGTIMSSIMKSIGVPYWIRLVAIPSGIVERGAISSFGGHLTNLIKGLQNQYLKYRYSLLKNPLERSKYRKRLVDKYGKTRTNKIIKLRQEIPDNKKSLVDRILSIT